jgi:autotransporter-associated beta strand protein
MKKNNESNVYRCKLRVLTAITLISSFTGLLPAEAGVPVGQSTLIDTPDYSDTFTVNTASRPGISYYKNPDAIDPYYNVESGTPTVQWHPTQNFSFNTDANVEAPYPGNTGNTGAATGMAQTGGFNANFAYGVRDTFVVQMDATFVGTDHIKLGTYASVGDQSGAAGSLVAYFRRGTIGLVSIVETSTGISTGIDAADTSWHNLAVEFNKADNTVSFFVDEVLKGTLDLTTFAGGAYLNYSNGAVGAGVSGYVGWFDNFQVGKPKGFVDGTLINGHRTEQTSVSGNDSITTLVDAGRLIKQGAGTLSITNAHIYNGTIEVADGTLDIGTGTSDLPSALRSGLAFWVDANRNVEVNGGEVTCWYDVREDSGGVTYPMARRFVSTNAVVDPGPTWVQGGDDVSGLKLVDFGAYGSGKWLQWQDAESNRLSIANIRTVFMVVSCTNGYGFLLGDWDDAIANTNAGTGDFHTGGNTGDGNPAGVALKGASWWNGSASPYVYRGQTFINGDYVNGVGQTVSSIGELMSLAATGNTQASNFGNNRNFKASDGLPGVNIDRQGGGRIGEVLIYSSALTISQRLQIESYLMKKWFGQGLGSLRIDEGAVATLHADGTNNLSNATISGIGTLNMQGSGTLQVSDMADPLLPPVRLNAGAGIDSGTLYQRTDQPYMLEGGSLYSVSNGLSSRQSLEDGTRIEKSGDGVLTAASIEAGVQRVEVKAGTLRLAPPLPGTAALTNALENASFETFTSVGTGGDANWGYTPTGTGWTITEDLSSGNSLEWSGAGLARCSAGTPWCAAQIAPEGDWCIFLKRAGEIKRTFEVPVSGRYEISFYTSARPNWNNHLYQVLVDTTNVIGSVRTKKTTFGLITCTTPPLSAGTHTLCFKGIYGTSDGASNIDAIEIKLFNGMDYVKVPNADFEEPDVPVVNLAGNDYYFAYNPSGASWNFIPAPAVTNSGITSGNNVWYYTQMKNGGQAAFLRQTGGMSTSITFPTTGVYRLSFRAAARVGDWGDLFSWYNGHDLEISLGGTLTARMTTWKPDFETVSYVLPVIEEGDPLTQTLTFTGLNSAGGDRATLIDEVSICRMPTFANPGFESSATLANGTWEAGIENAGWSFDLGAGATSQSGIAQTGSDWGNTAPDGGCNAFLQMIAQISQTITFDEAGTYEISFLAAGRPQNQNYLNHDFQVTFDGMKVGYVRTVDGTFRRYTFRLPFVKANVPYVLAFEGINHGDTTDRASFIDSVILTKIEEPTFDPAAFAKTEIALSAGTTLELDYDGLLTMERIIYSGRSYSGMMTAENTPFIQGTGSLYATPQGTIIILQ